MDEYLEKMLQPLNIFIPDMKFVIEKQWLIHYRELKDYIKNNHGLNPRQLVGRKVFDVIRK
jgi:hypothetical protein